MIKAAPLKVYTIWDSIQVFYYVTKSLGYAVFSIDGKIQNGKIRSTFWDLLIVFFLYVSVGSIIYFNYTMDLSVVSTNSFIIDMGNRLVTLFMVSNVLSSSLINGLRRHEIWSVFKKLSDFDKEVC